MLEAGIQIVMMVLLIAVGVKGLIIGTTMCRYEKNKITITTESLISFVFSIMMFLLAGYLFGRI